MRNTESLHELRETNNSLLTTKQNETMKVLTLMALVTFPLSLLVAIFDLNAKNNPITDIPYGFWFIVGMVIFFGTLMLWYFKRVAMTPLMNIKQVISWSNRKNLKAILRR